MQRVTHVPCKKTEIIIRLPDNILILTFKKSKLT